MKITVYTDGGHSTKRNLGSWAFIYTDPANSQDQEFSGVVSGITSNQAELLAAMKAIHTISETYGEGVELTLVSDSQYVVKGASEWLFGWKHNGWKTKAGKVKNQEYWKIFDSYIEKMNITFQWTKGHVGHEFNERVDALCTAAIQAV